MANYFNTAANQQFASLPAAAAAASDIRNQFARTDIARASQADSERRTDLAYQTAASDQAYRREQIEQVRQAAAQDAEAAKQRMDRQQMMDAAQQRLNIKAVIEGEIAKNGTLSPQTFQALQDFLVAEDPDAGGQAQLMQYSPEAVETMIAGFEGNFGAWFAENPVPMPQESTDQRARKISDLVRLNPGMDEATATAIVDGHVKVTPDQLGGVNVTDIRTAGQPQQTPVEPAQQPGMEGTGGIPGAGNSFGIEGAIKGAVNRGADVAGFGAPFPDVQEGQADFGVLREGVLGDMAAAWDRQPPAWVLKAMDANIPQAGNPFQGAGGAQAKLRALEREFGRRIATMEQQANGRMTQTDRADLRAKITATRAAQSRIQDVLGSFGGGGSTTIPDGFEQSVGDLPDGITAADIWDAMPENERSLWQ